MSDDILKRAKEARRGFIKTIAGGVSLFAFGGLLGKLITRTGKEGTVWQIDPTKCTQCGNCSEHCVLTPSAVKCVHDFTMCGYCRICTGFTVTDPPKLNEGAENQLCPTGAITRRFVEEPYYEYTIDENLCIGCGRCVKGCAAFGNGSLYLQINRDLCVNCNECSIEAVCEGHAIVRIPAEKQYLPKKHA
jgi:electron transport complex protein RnfB